MSKEEQKEEINNSKSAIVLKTIYTVLILLIMVNCIILITSILCKRKFQPITSKEEIIFRDNNNSNKELKTPVEKEEKIN